MTTTKKIIFSIMGLTLLLGGTVFAQGMMGNGTTGSSWGFMMLGSWLLYILVVVALILLVIWLIKQIKK